MVRPKRGRIFVEESKRSGEVGQCLVERMHTQAFAPPAPREVSKRFFDAVVDGRDGPRPRPPRSTDCHCGARFPRRSLGVGTFRVR